MNEQTNLILDLFFEENSNSNSNNENSNTISGENENLLVNNLTTDFNTENNNAPISNENNINEENEPKLETVNEIIENISSESKRRSIAEAIAIPELVWTEDIRTAVLHDAGVLSKYGTNVSRTILSITSLSPSQLKSIRNHPQYKAALSHIRAKFSRVIGDVTLSNKAARLQFLQTRHDAIHEVIHARQIDYVDDYITAPNGQRIHIPGLSSGIVEVKLKAINETEVTTEEDFEGKHFQQKTVHTRYVAEHRIDQTAVYALNQIEEAAAKEMGQRRETVDVSVTGKTYIGFDPNAV
jgi:hypothetical protein